MEVERATLEGGRITRVVLRRAAKTVCWADVLRSWRRDEPFREAFSGVLREAPYEALFWETPPLCRATLEQAFEFVMVDAPVLARARPEPSAFAAHLADARGTPAVRTFENLGGDALLVAPSKGADASCYPHLARFLRSAPEAQIHTLWREVARAAEARLGDRPLWVSTSGAGVYWLHVRIDSSPKYYTYAPYRAAPDP